MAGKTQTRKTTNAKKKKNSARETAAARQARQQMWAVVLFAVGLLLAALTFIRGEALWLLIHNFLFGVLGWSVYFLAPLMIYIAVSAAMDKPLSTIKTKLWQVIVLIVLIAGAIQIFAGLPDEGYFADNVFAVYQDGMNLRGGGLIGAAIAVPLLKLLGALGAKIFILLAIFVFTMLITGSSLISLYHYLRRPVEGIEEAYAEAVEYQRERRDERQARKEAQAAAAQAAEASRRSFSSFDIDISADCEPNELPSTPDLTKDLPELTPPTGSADPSHEDKLPERQEMSEEEIGDIVDRFFPREEAQQTPPPPAEPETALAAQTDVPPKEGSIPPMDVPEAEEAAPVYIYPPLELLSVPVAASAGDVNEELKSNAQTLVDTLKSFGAQTRITDICRGPAVTRYELQPSAGVKISRITGLADDIALNLAAAGIRIEAPIPNKAAVGIEVPNKVISTVNIREIIDSDEFRSAPSSLSVSLGRDIAGKITLADLGRMPHVLIAGSTGSGKSVCINSIIISLLYKSSPEEVKLLMVDPKVVELGVYNGIPHLLVPVVTDPKKAAGALNWAVGEMLRRYKTFADNAVRDLSGYNKMAAEHPELNLKPLPKIVIIIDELADLMMAAPGDVEDAICRLAQMARAAGMHLVIATQRPSVDVITGVIKANIPSRIAFAVSSQVDSRTILDMSGAEKLLGRGDMLFYPVGAAKPVRVQGCFVNDSEVEKVVEFVKQGETASYDAEIAEHIDNHVVAEKGKGKIAKDNGGGFDDEDEMLPAAIECVIEMGQASTSALQRRLKLGYARAARIIDQLEARGIVGPFEGSKPRQVLISKERWMEMKLSGAEDSARGSAGVPEDLPPFEP